ncbi:class I SAM-dependent RNA methyltransferase [Dermabacteraceae bacterium P13077]
MPDQTQNITLTCGGPANGGTFVARHEGRVVFVRGAAPEETVSARLLDTPAQRAKASFWRAQVVSVLEPSQDRVASIWPEAGEKGVGGADYAHIALPAQRRIKTEVVQDLFRRAKISTYLAEDIQVEPAPGDHSGLGWRTRVQFAQQDGLIGMRGWRSHEVFPVGENPLATAQVNALRVPEARLPQAVTGIEVAAPACGSRPAIVLRGGESARLSELTNGLKIPAAWEDASVIALARDGQRILQGEDHVSERVGNNTFSVHAAGFWQVHRQAPELLTASVMSALQPVAGEHVWDLFCGSGLFSVPLARALGESGRLLAVEGSTRAVASACRALADYPQARALAGDCLRTLRQQGGDAPDRVLLDPPRAGAGKELMRLLLERVKRRIVYVSCDAATLVRDLKQAENAGWHITDVRALDVFPHTHHVETVSVLER